MTSWIRGGALLLVAVVAMLPALTPSRHNTPALASAPALTPLEGDEARCTDFKIDFSLPIAGALAALSLVGIDIDNSTFQADVPDEGWVWVNPAQKYRSVAGVVEASHLAASDLPANHDSHDHNTVIKVDPEYIDVLARANDPNEDEDHPLSDPEGIEVEWELGTFPGETGRNEPERFFPKWAWPNVGDRVWTEGNWIYDCGHARDIGGTPHYRSEIHPPRVMAAMRQQVHTLPGSGTTAVPVTATDLYIHGRSGYVTDILTYGQSIQITGDPHGYPDDVNNHVLTPIATDYDFDVCLPPRPSPGAVPAYSYEDGPGNTINIAPELSIEPSKATCVGSALGPSALHVHVPLAGSGVSGAEVYARKIYAGWVSPKALRHFVVKLDRMDLHSDKEVEFSLGGDCECTFFYVNLDKASDEWYRLADWWQETCNISVDVPVVGTVCIDHNTLGDYDSDEGLGNGLLDFTGPTWDFVVPDGKAFNLRTFGYDQDCQEDLFNPPFLTPHVWNAVEYALCYYAVAITTFEQGKNDDFDRLNVCFVDTNRGQCQPFGDEDPPEIVTDYGVGHQDLHAGGGDFDMEFTVSEEPLADDTADLATTKSCAHDGEVALAGSPFTCTVTVTNAGPGLPSGAVISDTFTTALAGSTYTLSTPTFTTTLGTETSAPQSCTVTPPNAFSCAIDTVPVGGSVTATVIVRPSQPGSFDNTASVTATTTDPNTANNSASATVKVFLSVQIDIKPGAAPNSMSLSPGGIAAVAILRTATFNPATVNFASVCFGDVDAPLERDCTEAHRKAHMEDVDKDKDIDMLLHYEVEQTGIDLTDARACLIGNTTAGIGIFGCDSVRPLK